MYKYDINVDTHCRIANYTTGNYSCCKVTNCEKCYYVNTTYYFHHNNYANNYANDYVDNLSKKKFIDLVQKLDNYINFNKIFKCCANSGNIFAALCIKTIVWIVVLVPPGFVIFVSVVLCGIVVCLPTY